MSIKSQTQDDEYSDPSAVILPHVTSNEEVLGSYGLEDLVLFVPLIPLAGITLFALLSGNGLIAGLLTPLTVIGVVLAFYFSKTSTWYAPPRERFRDWVKYLGSRQSLPWGFTDAIGVVHGVRNTRADGSVKCRDGRYAVALPVYGVNGDNLKANIMTQLVGSLRNGVNTDLHDTWFAYYATTRDASNDKEATAWEDRASEVDRDATDLTELQELTLLDDADWLREADADWEANDWRDFIELQVFPYEYDMTQEELDDEREKSGVQAKLSHVKNAISGRFGNDFAIPEDEDSRVRTPTDVFEERLSEVHDAIGNIDGVHLGQPTPAMAAELMANYWTDSGNIDEDDLAKIVDPERKTLDGEFTPTEKLLTPDYYDNIGTTMQLGNMLARTYWISEWPLEPDPFFLRDLQTLEEVNLDIRIIGQPEDKQEVIDELEIIIAAARGEEERRDEEGEVTSLEIVDDIDALEQAYHCLQQTDAQSRQLSGYITVRAETRKELRQACDTVKKELKSHPTSCVPVASGTRQKEAFASGAPFAPNVYERATWTEKVHRALPGAFGNMFPFLRTSLRESDGIRWGRNSQDGTTLWVDPFNRGTAPHLITIGKSRGGKTYAVSQAVAEWFMADDDRTLLLCDTQGGFDGLTELLDGDHIIIDSGRGVNPFYIQPSHDGSFNMGLKIDEVTEFIAGILRAQNIDPSDYRPTIQLAVQQTYNEFGITPDSVPDELDCPTIGDFLEMLDEIIENPGTYSHTDHNVVAEKRKEKVADLLEKLTGFMESGKYEHLVDETEGGITPGTKMAYLDLRHFEDATAAEKSVHLHLMLSQVSQLIKQTPGETIFVIDEAHLLLHSEEMMTYLQSATREWARYEAAMWFVSQSPQEFVRRSSETEQGQQNDRSVILEQCSTVQTFRCGGDEIDSSALLDIGIPPALLEIVERRLTPGRAGKGYSECLISFDDEPGRFRTRVEAPPLLDLILQYKWHDHGEFTEYLRKNAGPEVAQLASNSREDLADVATDDEISATVQTNGYDDTETELPTIEDPTDD